MGCIPSKNHQKIKEIGNNFMSKSEVKALYKNPSIIVYKKFEQLFGYNPSEWKAFEPSKTDINAFKRELNKVYKQIKKGKVIGLTGSQLYTTSAVVRRNPILAEVYDNFLKVNYEFRGRSSINERDFENLLSYLRDESIFTGMLPGRKGFKNAIKDASKLESEIQSLIIDKNNGVPGSRESLKNKMGELDTFLSKGEGKVFKDFVNLIESKETGLRSVPEVQKIVKERWGKALTDKNMNDIKNAIFKITKSARMQNALTKYVEIMHNVHNSMQKGVEAYISSIQEGALIKGASIAEIKSLKDFLLKKLMPDEKAGYFPHYRYDMQSLMLDGLMPKLDNLSEATRFMDPKRGKGIDEALNDVKTQLTSRVKKRTPDLNNKDYSMNFVAVVKRYMDEINRFNFMAHTQRYTRQALREAKNAFHEGKDLEGYGAQFVDMIMDMNLAQTGSRTIVNPEFEAASRALLNLEFTSKLGLNVRSAAKNSTQWLLNTVQFGPVLMKRSKEAYARDRDLERSVEIALEQSGLSFEVGADITAIGGETNPFKNRVRLNGLGEIEFVNPSKISQFADFTGRVAGKSGIFMRTVENINRKSTYKYAFYEMYSQLKNNSGFREVLSDKKGRDITQKELDSAIFRKAQRYAERMTTLLHFDYSSVSKSKAMRSSWGRFLLQFQHYAHSFGALNMKILREGGDAALARDFTFSGKMGQVYRMGMVYALAPALVSVITENDIFRVVQHDTYERLQELYTFLTGDAEEIQEATYGRGALGALVGAPVFSDALAIGELARLWELDDEGLLQLLIGYNDSKDLSDDQRIAKIARLFNVQFGRTAFQTGSMLTSKHWLRGFGHELGFYPTKRAKDMREWTVAAAEQILPDAAINVLDTLFSSPSKEKAKKRKTNPRRYFY